MSGQVSADCCVEQFALGAGWRPFFCLGKTGFENLQTMEVQILANSGESERINQLCLRMAEVQITLDEAWHFRPAYCGAFLDRRRGGRRLESTQGLVAATVV
jgi:hypothetical protein